MKSENNTYIAPRNVADNAQLALDVRASKPMSQRGMTPIGLARARQLANREPIRVETIRRMVAYFSRHEIDKEGSTWPDRGKGWQAWYGWGGDEGWTWAKQIIAKEDAVENKASRRHSEADMKLIRSTRKMATKIISTLSELGDDGADDNYDSDTTPISDMSVAEVKQLTPPGYSGRQEEMIASYEAIALELGQWSQGISESGAHYAPESPYDDEGIKCEHCVFYKPDTGMCTIVSGNINPEGICKLWIIPENILVKYALEPMIESEQDYSLDDMEVMAISDRDTTDKERADMPAGDFVIPESRNFPVITPDDIPAAVSSWGRYRGPISFEDFKTRLIALAKRKGSEFYSALPVAWIAELENKHVDVSGILEVTADVKNYARWLMGRNEVGS